MGQIPGSRGHRLHGLQVGHRCLDPSEGVGWIPDTARQGGDANAAAGGIYHPTGEQDRSVSLRLRRGSSRSDVRDKGGIHHWFWAVGRACLAGYVATLVMERVAGFLYDRQEEAARDREEQLRKAMPTAVLVEKVVGLVGMEPDPATARSIGTWVQYAFGAAGGVGVLLLQRRGWGGLPAGLAVGVGMTASVDEGINYFLGVTAPPTAWPWQVHARGILAHLAYGMVLGALMNGRTDPGDALTSV